MEKGGGGGGEVCWSVYTYSEIMVHTFLLNLVTYLCVCECVCVSERAWVYACVCVSVCVSVCLCVCLYVCTVSSITEPLQNAVLTKPGENLTFVWPLPDSLREATLVVSLNTPSNLLFLATTLSAVNTTAVVTRHYEHRLHVQPRFDQGLVQFTLSDVVLEDAGKYMCTRGVTQEDVVEGCGQTVVVVGQ